MLMETDRKDAWEHHMEKELQSKFSARQYMLSKDYEIYYYSEKAASQVASHSHDYYEFYFFLEGDVSIVIENVAYSLKYGDMVLIPPQVAHHRIIHTANRPYRRFVLWIRREYLMQRIKESASYGYLVQRVQETKQYLFSNDIITFHAIEFQIFTLLEETKFARFGSEAQASLCINTLLLQLNRIVYEKEHKKSVKEQQNLCRNVIYYIEEHLEEELSLEQLSKQFFLSKYHIAHTFKNQMGISVHQYILKKRMQVSREAILSGERISTIYVKYGFGDYSSFYRAFKKEYGVAPKEYRELYFPEHIMEKELL